MTEAIRKRLKRPRRSMMFLNAQRPGLLKDAYVKARYSKHYHISPEDLAWLGERVRELSGVVQTIASERIASLQNQAV